MGSQMKKRISLTGLLLGLCFPAPIQAAGTVEFNVQVHQLTNGMKVLLLEDHAIPNVATHLFYRVGSRNERPGITGLSHFFEHMMFNGAKKFGPGMFDRVMEDNGGANNAFTSEDITAYQDWHPTAAMPLIFELEADRITSLSFDSGNSNSVSTIAKRRPSVATKVSLPSRNEAKMPLST